VAQKVGLFVVAFSTVWGLICDYKIRCHTYLSDCPAVCYTCNHVNVAGHRDHMVDPIYHRGYWMPNFCGRIVICLSEWLALNIDDMEKIATFYQYLVI